MPGTGPAAIRTEHLTKRFGGRLVVDDVRLEVAAGEVFGFLGPNGAGKTTTIAMLLGLVRPDAGRIALLGHDLADDPGAALAGVGALTEAAFYPYLSARDNLRVLTRAGGLPDRRADAVLAEVGLAPRARDRVATFSRGMRQRLGIAAALLAEPTLLVLDEPSEGLDPAGQHEVHGLIRACAAAGHTVFFSSHVLSEVERVCTRVAILRAGRVVAEGAVDELLRAGARVAVRVAGDAAAAAAWLRTLGGVTDVAEDGDVLLIDTAVERAAELNALLVARGVRVAEVRARRRPLEDVFLELTEDR